MKSISIEYSGWNENDFSRRQWMKSKWFRYQETKAIRGLDIVPRITLYYAFVISNKLTKRIYTDTKVFVLTV